MDDFRLYAALSTYALISVVYCRQLNRPRGVSLAKATLYELSENFTCFDGSSVIDFQRINDDYCDCADGSDEPGTSACANGTFDCNNTGYRESNIPSSRVNDGVCDCCDGSDEYESDVKCDNNCFALGRRVHEESQRLYRLGVDGHELYKEYCRRGQELGKLLQQRAESKEKEKADLASLRAQLLILRDSAQQQEREAMDRQLAAWTELREASQLIRADAVFTELDVNSDGLVSVDELLLHTEFDSDADGFVSADEATACLGARGYVDEETFVQTVWNNIQHVYKPINKSVGTEVAAEDPVEGEMDDGETEGHEETANTYDDDTRQLILAAEHARNVFTDVDAKWRAMDDIISQVQRSVAIDFGSASEYLVIYSVCYNISDVDYVYTLCPFCNVTQRAKSGDFSALLGLWSRWEANTANNYQSMVYDSGDNCGQTHRSTKVTVLCGPVERLVTVNEPAQCQYQLTFSTAAACSQVPTLSTGDPLHDEL